MPQDVILMTFIFTSVSFTFINSVQSTEYLTLNCKPMGRERGDTENKMEAPNSFSNTGTGSMA
jgi:hypothetical protein